MDEAERKHLRTRVRSTGVMARVVKQLLQAEAAYLAGLVDGEGTITLAHIHKGANRQLSVSITNTERQLLDWVKNVVGAGRITMKRPYSHKHMPGYTYAVANTQALDLLRQIAPYLQTHKRLRAEMVLERYKALTPRNGRYSPELLAERERFVQAVLAITSRVAPSSNAGVRTGLTSAKPVSTRCDGNAEG